MRAHILLCSYMALLSSVLIASPAEKSGDRSRLAETFEPRRLSNMLVGTGKWNPYPKIDNRAAWQSISASLRQAYVQAAEKDLGKPWPQATATLFMDYVRTGNRTRYQDISFGRRERLAQLVLAECMENKGRFVDDIVNGIWLICEETYWGVPAHMSIQAAGSGLPDVTEPTVDLFAAETGMLLAWCHYLLGERLDDISPLVRPRIRTEVQRRILTPNLERDDFWWMSFKGGRINNWNPWINSNWLICLLLLEDNRQRQVRAVHKILSSLDIFIAANPADGGCDEGPVYWTRAAASLFDCLEILDSASDGQISIWDDALIRAMGRFICGVHIDKDVYISFADAVHRRDMPPSLIWRYGNKIEDQRMQAFGAWLAREQHYGDKPLHERFGVLARVLPALFNLSELRAPQPASPPLLRDFWLPELQVMASRSADGSGKGLYLAAKGGHNDESHNHNDIGNFIIAVDGEQVIIDIGAGVYTKKTFSPQRYSIWTMQSSWHNTPDVNGVAQAPGPEYKSGNVVFQEDDVKAVFELDISDAYPDSALVESYQRRLTLERGKRVLLEDAYVLKQVKAATVLNFVTAWRPEEKKPGELWLISPQNSDAAIKVLYDQGALQVSTAPRMLEDSRLRSGWGEQIWRLRFSTTSQALQNQISMQFVPHSQ